MTDDELEDLENENRYEIEGLPLGRTVPGVGVQFPPDTFDRIKILAFLEVLLGEGDHLRDARVRSEGRIHDQLEMMKSNVRQQMIAGQVVPQGVPDNVLDLNSRR